MTIKVGDKIPSVTLQQMKKDGVVDITSNELFDGKKVVVFGLPGAFTPTCSASHLPGYVVKSDELFAKGVDAVAKLRFSFDVWAEVLFRGW